jgi:hypothetical protein
MKYIPQRRCWKCNYPQREDIQLNTLEMKEQRFPRPGDISICGACGSFGVYMPDLTIMEPPNAVMEVIENTPELMEMQRQLMSRDGI